MNQSTPIGDDAVVSMFALNVRALSWSGLSFALHHRLGAIRDLAKAEMDRQYAERQAEQAACAECREYAGRGGPSHRASPGCESGRRNHCSCDTCF